MSQNETIHSQSSEAEHQHIVIPDDKERLKRAPYARTRKDFKVKYTGKCFCETVQFEIAEDPLGMSNSFICDIKHNRALNLDASYCHCRDCQRLHGAPYQWAAIYHKDAVHFSQGEEELIFYNPQYALYCTCLSDPPF